MGEMTKGEAIKYGTEWLKDEYLDAKDRAFIKIALEVLEQEPSGDLISREETLTAFADYVGSGMSMNDYDALWNIVTKMPSVEQEPKWIPVSERLPEICEKDCHGDITFSKTVIATQIYGNGYVYVGIDKYTTNNGGGWLSEVPFDNPDECCKVIAWMPLPEPYKVEPRESDHKCHTCKHYTSGENDGSCGSYICKGYSNWESEE